MCADAGATVAAGATGMRVFRTIAARAMSIAYGEDGGLGGTSGGRAAYMRSNWIPPGAASIGFCDCVRRDTVLYCTACANMKTGPLTILGKRESALRLLPTTTFDRDASYIAL